MCTDTCRPECDYLARLRPMRLDVSDAYGASGRRIFFLMNVSNNAEAEAEADKAQYQSIVGSLMYAAQATRPILHSLLPRLADISSSRTRRI